MKTYSYFAECAVDSIAFISAIRSTVAESIGGEQWFDCFVTDSNDDFVIGCAREIKTDMTMGQLLKVARSIPDCHVIRQTLRPVLLSENNLERDFTIF